jgi:hypothetical protein
VALFMWRAHQQPDLVCKLAAGRHKVSLLSSLVSQRLTWSTSHRMTATIGFNAVRFQPSFATHLLLAFAELVVIERLPIRDVFPEMLGLSYKLGRHSDVFLLMPDGLGSLTVTRFSWTHSELRPWGQYLPVQCPQCGWANAWRSVNMHKDYVFECKNGSCRKGYTFSQPAHSRILLPGKRPGSCWISITVDPTPGLPHEDEDDA